MQPGDLIAKDMDKIKQSYLLSNILNQMSNYHFNEFLRILDAITEGIMITDGNDVIVHVNRNHALMEFMKSEDLIGHSVYEIIEKGHCRKLSEFDGKDMKGYIKPDHLKMCTRTGREIIITGIPLTDDHNQIKLIVYTSRDITEFEELRNDLEREISLRQHYEKQINSSYHNNLMFISEAMKKVYHTVVKVSQVDSSVFLMGESGTGKDVIAREIHNISHRSQKPFIHVNCAAIPDTLWESELFGYKGGAFTGALTEGKPGLLELAAGGTFYLDEISETPISIQAKLLQVLQNRVFRRDGGLEDLTFEARVIASTNRNIWELIEQRTFRSDLFYRLCVVPILVPPLRERKEDILLLAEFFLRKLNEKNSTKRYLSDKLIDYICNHNWLGNVRELENYIEMLYVITDSDCIYMQDYAHIEAGQGLYISFENDMTLREADDKVEKFFINRSLAKHRNTRLAAEALGISQATLLRKVHKYGIDLADK